MAPLAAEELGLELGRPRQDGRGLGTIVGGIEGLDVVEAQLDDGLCPADEQRPALLTQPRDDAERRIADQVLEQRASRRWRPVGRHGGRTRRTLDFQPLMDPVADRLGEGFDGQAVLPRLAPDPRREAGLAKASVRRVEVGVDDGSDPDLAVSREPGAFESRGLVEEHEDRSPVRDLELDLDLAVEVALACSGRGQASAT